MPRRCAAVRARAGSSHRRTLCRVPLQGSVCCYCASPICFMNPRLSQNSYYSAIIPCCQCPTLHMMSSKALPVGAMVMPSPIDIGCVNEHRLRIRDLLRGTLVDFLTQAFHTVPWPQCG